MQVAGKRLPTKCQCNLECNNPVVKGPFCAEHAKGMKCLVSPLSGAEPHYMKSVYNEKQIKQNHNCFAYAMDVLDMEGCEGNEDCKLSFHQPGYRAGHPRFTDDGKKYCADLLIRLKGDLGDTIMITMPVEQPNRGQLKQRPILFTDKAPPGWSKIALVIDPANDYHFYRQDSNGMWSHKPGGQLVTNKDANGSLIYNPERCSRDYRKPGVDDPEQLNYSVFCAYLFVRREGAIPVSRVQKRQQGGSLSPIYSRMAGRRTKTRKVGGVRTPSRGNAAAAAAAAAPTSSSRRRVPVVGATRYRKQALNHNRIRDEALAEARSMELSQQGKSVFIREAIRQAQEEAARQKREHQAVIDRAKRDFPGNPKAQSEAISAYYLIKKVQKAHLDYDLAQMIAGMAVAPAAAPNTLAASLSRI